ncbi:hypothetical protein Sarmat_00351 [Rickettsiales endosymbiont of Paramecium tredecaurelia]|uniref:hypothetical protein n=1 Tax=Candidatus Sarmatiella mevalonica TaxID=2770581 RepID=UPI00192351C3|nr:hypothetical protein [Candidatus Sarmatiella mevalonica]MBL3284505.1 hypothetical protein [Candidatus Sarmatiella mevalonica]
MQDIAQEGMERVQVQMSKEEHEEWQQLQQKRGQALNDQEQKPEQKDDKDEELAQKDKEIKELQEQIAGKQGSKFDKFLKIMGGVTIALLAIGALGGIAIGLMAAMPAIAATATAVGVAIGVKGAIAIGIGGAYAAYKRKAIARGWRKMKDFITSPFKPKTVAKQEMYYKNQKKEYRQEIEKMKDPEHVGSDRAAHVGSIHRETGIKLKDLAALSLTSKEIKRIGANGTDAFLKAFTELAETASMRPGIAQQKLDQTIGGMKIGDESMRDTPLFKNMEQELIAATTEQDLIKKATAEKGIYEKFAKKFADNFDPQNQADANKVAEALTKKATAISEKLDVAQKQREAFGKKGTVTEISKQTAEAIRGLDIPNRMVAARKTAPQQNQQIQRMQ